jgi:hypothetical protein
MTPSCNCRLERPRGRVVACNSVNVPQAILTARLPVKRGQHCGLIPVGITTDYAFFCARTAIARLPVRLPTVMTDVRLPLALCTSPSANETKRIANIAFVSITSFVATSEDDIVSRNEWRRHHYSYHETKLVMSNSSKSIKINHRQLSMRSSVTSLDPGPSQKHNSSSATSTQLCSSMESTFTQHRPCWQADSSHADKVWCLELKPTPHALKPQAGSRHQGASRQAATEGARTFNHGVQKEHYMYKSYVHTCALGDVHVSMHRRTYGCSKRCAVT